MPCMPYMPYMPQLAQLHRRESTCNNIRSLAQCYPEPVVHGNLVDDSVDCLGKSYYYMLHIGRLRHNLIHH
jgi:hypothetical protein